MDEQQQATTKPEQDKMYSVWREQRLACSTNFNIQTHRMEIERVAKFCCVAAVMGEHL